MRAHNEDRFLIADLARLPRVTPTVRADRTDAGRQGSGLLAVVADGMGGHAGGEVASALTVDELERSFSDGLPGWLALQRQGEAGLRAALEDALERCQRRVEEAAATDPQLRGMGTTATLALALWPRLHIAHVGDSRCYLFRDGMLERLTSDHTMAQRLVDEGALDPEEARSSPYRSMLWNAIGGGTADLRPQSRQATLHRGDRLLLCSDGLTNHVSDETLLEVLADDGPAREACAELVRLANEGGGQDNITVVLVRFEHGSDAGLAATGRHEAPVTLRLHSHRPK